MSKINCSKEDLIRLIFEENLSYEKIGKMYGITRNSIKKYARKLGIILSSRRLINPKESFNKGSKTRKRKLDLDNISDEDFLIVIEKSNTISDIIRNLLGEDSNCNNINSRISIRNKCKELGIDISKSGKIIKYSCNKIVNTISICEDNISINKQNILLLQQHISGIYMIENNINHHKYIGQSIDIRNRLLQHINVNTWDKFSDYPLYRAFKKYGIESFSFRILISIGEKEVNSLKNLLDSYEMFYIKEFNTFGGNGYNQTTGGDGVLGYKMTSEQKQHMKTIKEVSGKYTIWYYDLDTDEYNCEPTSHTLGEKLNIPYKTLRKYGILIRKRYITAKSKDKLEEFVLKYKKK